MFGALVKKLTGIAQSIVGAAQWLLGGGKVNVDLVREITLVINTKRDSLVCEFCGSMDGRRIKCHYWQAETSCLNMATWRKHPGGGSKIFFHHSIPIADAM